jgi:flagellar assembly factor FliW
VARGVRGFLSMPSIETKYFGAMPYSDGIVYEFLHGLPAFEDEKRFLLIEAPNGGPLIFLQSMKQASLCFVAFPIRIVDQGYEPAIALEDLEELGLDVTRQPDLGAEVLVLALLSLDAKAMPTANLMAPVVFNLKTRGGLQAIRRDFRYSHQYPLSVQVRDGQGEEEAC